MLAQVIRVGAAGALVVLSRGLTASASAIAGPVARNAAGEQVAGAAPAGKPMYQMDPQHTGRSPYAGPRVAVVARTFDMGFPTGQSDPAIARQRAEVQSSSAVGADGTMYFTNFQGNLFALRDPGTGDTLSVAWHLHVDGQSSLHATPAVGPNNTVYLPLGPLGAGVPPSSKLYAVSAPTSGSDPTMLWTVDLGPSRTSSSPTLGPDGTVYAVSGAGKLFAISPDGGVKWTATTGPMLRAAPALAADGTVYLASLDGKLYAVAPPAAGGSDGVVQWTFDLGTHLGPTALVTDAKSGAGANGIGSIASPTIAPDGTIYLGGSNSNFYAITAQGQLKWLFEAQRELAGIASTAALSADNQTLYFGANKGGIYAVNAADGSLRWQYDIYGSIFNSPALDSQGILYTGSTVGHVFAIDTAAGKRVFDYDAGAAVWTAPSILPNGSIAFATRPGEVTLLQSSLKLPSTGGGGTAT